MVPMTQEFVTELDDEHKLNAEIDELLDGIDSFPEENGFNTIHQMDIDRHEQMSSPVLFSQEEVGNISEQKGMSQVPVLQPFTNSEEKSPHPNEDPMDILEELPISDIGDTYLTEEQFNEKYPQHTIDQQQQMETEPHVCDLEELARFLNEQEQIEQTLLNGNMQVEMDNFILEEVLNGNTNPPVEDKKTREVQLQLKTESTKQSQVCFLNYFI